MINNLNERRQKIEYIKKTTVFKKPEIYLANLSLDLDQIMKNFVKNAEFYISNQNLVLNRYIDRLETLSPLSTLKRGYSICIREYDKKVVKQLADIESGHLVRIVLSDGNLLCNVKERQKKGDN